MNSDVERQLGILIAQGKYFTKELHDIKSDVKLLIADRNKRIGMNIITTAIFTGIFEFILTVVKH